MESLSESLEKRSIAQRFVTECFRLILIALGLWALFLASDVNASERSRIERVAVHYAERYGVDPQLVLAIIETESSFNPNAVGTSHREIGLMQLHPRFFPDASFDIEENIHAGVRYLAYIQDRKAEKVGCVWFVYYNVGINRQLRYPERHPYVQKVLSK